MMTTFSLYTSYLGHFHSVIIENSFIVKENCRLEGSMYWAVFCPGVEVSVTRMVNIIMCTVPGRSRGQVMRSPEISKLQIGCPFVGSVSWLPLISHQYLCRCTYLVLTENIAFTENHGNRNRIPVRNAPNLTPAQSSRNMFKHLIWSNSCLRNRIIFYMNNIAWHRSIDKKIMNKNHSCRS